MKLWGYYAFHTFINSIKKMFRSKVIIVFVVMVAIGFIFGFSAGIITDLLDDNTQVEEEQREGYGDEEYGLFDENGKFLFFEDLYEEGLGGYDEEGEFIYYEDALEQNLGYYDAHGEFVFYYEEMTEEDIHQLMLVVEAIALVIVLLLVFFGAYSGMKKGSDIFIMADVNFLFTAPMKPQTVLLFRLTFQMLATFAGSIYFLFQIPNLVLNAGLSLGACLLMFLALIITFIFQKLASVGMYTYTATHEKARRWVLPILIGIALIIVTAVGLVFVSNDMDVWKTLELTLSSKWARLIPIVGWVKGFVFHAWSGNWAMLLVYFVLILLSMAGVVYLIWHMKADFYEDAMAGAQAREDVLQAISEQRTAARFDTNDGKKKDKRKVKESQKSLFGNACGAQTFFAKELIVRRRLAKFGVMTTTMMWYLTICVGMALINVKFLNVNDFSVTGFILMAVLFFRNFGNPIAQETAMNWLFLVPESAYKKVFFAMLSGSYATVMDLLPGMAIAMLIMKISPLTMLLWLAALFTMDFMLSAVGLLLEALFPASAMEMVKASIQMLLKFMLIFIVVIAVVVGVLLGGVELGLICTIVTNIIFGAIGFVIYPSMYHNGIA